MRKTGQSDLPTEEGEETPSSNVVLLGTYSEIPAPDFHLDPVGRKIYDEWCRTLLSAGLLTIKSKDQVEMYAIAKSAIADALKKGKTPPRNMTEAFRAASLRLEKLDANKTLGEASGHANPYATFGFAKRAKKEQFGQ